MGARSYQAARTVRHSDQAASQETKTPCKNRKAAQQNNRKMVPSHKKQVTYSEDFVPVKDIRNGIIEMEDGRYIKVLEVEPINFLLRSTSEQKNIVASFASWMKISPIKIQIKVLTKKADIGKHLSTIERDMESESNPKCRELQLDYYRLIQTIGSREAITRRFLVILSMKLSRIANRSTQRLSRLWKRLFRQRGSISYTATMRLLPMMTKTPSCWRSSTPFSTDQLVR